MATGWGAPHNYEIDSTLQPGYTPPAGNALSPLLARGTDFDYGPSPNYAVDVVMAAGYTPPAGNALNALLTRQGGGGETGTIYARGSVLTRFGNMTVLSAPVSGNSGSFFLVL